MEKIIPRDFSHSDIDDVFLLYENEGIWFEDIGISREYIMECSRREDFRFFIAKDIGKTAGFIGCLFFPNVGRAEVGPIVVSKEFRDMGVGKSLLSKALDFLSMQGISRVSAKVKAENRGAIVFFMKSGFSTEAYLRGYTQKSEDIVELATYL
jgi:ribosomal protein S18 acetylase RimI-like enzyme